MNPLFLAYGALGGVIVCEVIATTLLQKSEQFSKPLPTAAMVVFYVVSFYLLSQALKGVPLGIAYAVWSGLGIVLVSLIGLVVFGQKLDLPAIVGLGLIIAGVVIVNLFSGSVSH